MYRCIDADFGNHWGIGKNGINWKRSQKCEKPANDNYLLTKERHYIISVTDIYIENYEKEWCKFGVLPETLACLTQ